MAHTIATVAEDLLAMEELHAFELAMNNVLMDIVLVRLITSVFAISDGQVNHALFRVAATIIRRV